MSKIKDVDISKSLLLIISVIFASIIINLFIRCGFDFSYLKLSAADINKLDEVSYTTSAIFVLIKRLKHIILIVLFMKVIKPEIVYSLLMIALSFMFGVFVTTQTYYSGMTGVIELILYLFPHYIVYIVLLYEIHKLIKDWTKDSYQLGKIVFFMVILCCGVLCEGIFSRFFLERFYQYIVI